MIISQTRVLNIDRYINPELSDQFVRVVSKFEDAPVAKLNRFGIETLLEEGETFLPPPMGPVSRFNSEGRWMIRRDQPKERRYIRTIYWQWKQWGGEEREEARDIFLDCYPRDFVFPPADEIFGFPVEERIVAATEAIGLPQGKGRLLHQVNLMLEVFGSCEIVRADGTSASPAQTQRRWQFLPPGPFKKGDVPAALDQVFARMSEGDRTILSDRQDFLTELEPTEIARGIGGFNDYLAYVMPQFGRVVLESLRRDNAIYIFKDSWERFSRLSKREILDSAVHDARILHTTGWKSRLLQALEAP